MLQRKIRMAEDSNIIELQESQKTKVKVEVNDQDYLLVSIPTKFIKWIGKKLFKI